MKKRTVIFLLLTLIAISPAKAAVTIIGSPSCGGWTEGRVKKGAASLRIETWLIAYMSGMAVISNRDILLNIDNQSIYLWMDNWCRTNPLEGVSQGGSRLFHELIARQDNKQSAPK